MPRLISSRYAFRGLIVSVRQDEIEMDSGTRRVFDVIEHPGAVAMVPLTSDGEVLLVRQFRPAVGGDSLEIPAGTIENGETPEACARRELAEEVGQASDYLERLAGFYPSPGFLSEFLTVFLARGLNPRVVPREEEDLRIERLPIDAARRRIATGEIQDSKSIIGILLACERLRA
jgi:ADP-ribose pyrophosphatase